MKSSLKLVLYILIVSFIIDKGIYFILNSFSDKVFTGQSIGKLNHYLMIKDSSDLVVFGSSRANRHINTKLITPSSFNMGLDGTSIANYSTLIKLLPKNKNQVVIVNVDTKNAFNENYAGDDIKLLRLKYHRNKIIKEEVDKAKLNDILQNFYWSKGYNGRVLGIFKNFLIPKYDYKQYYGYDPIIVNENEKKLFQNYLKYHKAIKCTNDYKINSVFEYYLNEIKEFCNNNNKRLIIVTAPLYNDECKDDNELLAIALNKMKIDYHDFSNFFEDNNDLKYWKDDTHLSMMGADLFSENLKNLLQQNLE